MKKALIIIAAVVLAAAIAAGSFYGGMTYQKNQANTVRTNFLRERGLDSANPGGGLMNPNAAGGSFPGGGGAMGGGVSGEIKSIDDHTITLTTAQSETKVSLSDTTTIQMTNPGSLNDLQTGQQVMVTGQRDEDGNITAVQVLILQTGVNTSP
jgi:hypothetical protein